MPRGKSLLSTKPQAMQDKVRQAPLVPGCYLYKNAQGRVLYVGKAKVLRNRVKSYFSNFDRVEEKIRQMLGQAENIDFVLADSEVEALIIENILIKKYKPKYNSMLVDDKSYAYVKFKKLSTSNGEYVPVPTVELTREKQHEKDAEYFGPYPDVQAVKRLLGRLRKVFPYCTSKVKVVIPASKDQYFESKQTRACFQYQVGLCNGVCAGLVTRGEYEVNLNKIKQFFKGEKNKLVEEIENKMKAAAKTQDFEQAARYRNMLRDIKYVGSNLRLDKDWDEIAIMQQKAKEKQSSIENLISRLNFPTEKLKNHAGFRVECYDISNIQGTNAVGAMTVSIDGQAVPQLYRRFKIKFVKNEPNDFAMMQEILARRFAQYLKSQEVQVKNQGEKEKEQHLDNEITSVTDNEGFTVEIPKELQKKLQKWQPDESFSQMPDLIIIDGGKGQLSSAYKVLKDSGLENTIPVVGLAKREEEIFKIGEQFQGEPDTASLDLSVERSASVWGDGGLVMSDTSDNKPMQQLRSPRKTYMPIDKVDIFEKIKLPRKSEALYLVQRVRDEAHRFGITYHRKLRSKAALVTDTNAK